VSNPILILLMVDLTSICKSWLIFDYVNTSLSCFWRVGINHQKGEIERGMCAWAISVVLVIKCSTHYYDVIYLPMSMSTGNCEAN
jgi:hypothetical protein